MFATCNYTPIKKGRYYKKVGEGLDFYMVRWNGQVMHVPKWVFLKKNKEEEIIEKELEEELEEYEEIL